MAMQTIERPTALAGNDPVTQVIPPKSKLLSPYVAPATPIETEEAVEERQAAATFEGSAYPSAKMHKDRFLATLWKQMVRSYDWLSGPPPTQRDLAMAAHIRAKHDWTNYW